VLQVILEKEYNAFGRLYYGAIPKECFTSFHSYVEVALKKLNFPIKLSHQQISDYWDKFGAPNFKAIIAYDMLRFCLASALERAVLEDRREFLRENGIQSELVDFLTLKFLRGTWLLLQQRKNSNRTLLYKSKNTSQLIVQSWILKQILSIFGPSCSPARKNYCTKPLSTLWRIGTLILVNCISEEHVVFNSSWRRSSLFPWLLFSRRHLLLPLIRLPLKL